MRLINADKLVDLIDEEIPQDGEDDYTNGLAKAMEIILKMYFDKSVDAIPIEWIEEYRQNREDYADEYNAKAVLKRLLETWEKENEFV